MYNNTEGETGTSRKCPLVLTDGAVADFTGNRAATWFIVSHEKRNVHEDNSSLRSRAYLGKKESSCHSENARH